MEKKKILIIADLRGWAFHSHAKQIQKRLTEYQIDIAYSRGSNIAALSPNYDLIYSMDPMPIPYVCPDKTIMGVRVDWFHTDHPRGAKGMYEEGFLGRSACIKGNCCMMHAVNKKQLEIYKSVIDIPILLVQHGVDVECFDRNKYKKTKNKILTIGTSGRKASNNKKGFELVEKACNKIGMKHYKTRYKKKIPKEQMPEFYNNIDVYVCMSRVEGLHNPTLESGAMSVPVISTRCGASEEMIIDGENGLLIDRNVNSLVAALGKMKDDKFRLEMGKKFHQEIITNWVWKVKVENFRNMFEEFFRNH